MLHDVVNAWEQEKEVWLFRDDIWAMLLESPYEGGALPEMLAKLPAGCMWISCERAWSAFVPHKRGVHPADMSGSGIMLSALRSTDLQGFFVRSVEFRCGPDPGRVLVPHLEVICFFARGHESLGFWPYRAALDQPTAKKEFRAFRPEWPHHDTGLLFDEGSGTDFAGAFSEYSTKSWLHRILSLLLCLCSEEHVADEAVPSESDGTTRVQQGHLVSRETVRIRHVQATSVCRIAGSYSEDAGGTHRSPVAHTRRAHWHSFWVGTGEQKRLEARWVMLTRVNGGAGDSTITVRHLS
jgi:hypothetical protein